MRLSTFLQIFLIIDVFFMGALAAVAARHAYAHFRPQKPDPEKPHASAQNAHLPASVREHLLETAQANFEQVLTKSAGELQKDLEDTTSKINKLLDKLAAGIVSNEMEHYRTELTRLNKQAEEGITGARAEIAKHQEEMKAKLAEEMELEKQHLIQLMDTKLADSVASFLLDTLQHNVDLGAQSAYLTSVLEEHKADFAKEITDEPPTA